MLILEIPLAVIILWFTFRPEQTILDSAVRKLKIDVTKTGKMTGNQILAIVIFIAVFFWLGLFKSCLGIRDCCADWSFFCIYHLDSLNGKISIEIQIGV